MTDWNVVNVADAEPGVRDGGKPLNEVLSAHTGPRTKFVLPEGRYHLDGRFYHNDAEAVAVVGDPHATLVVTDPDQQYGLDVGGDWGVSAESSATTVEIRNLTFDMTAEDVGAQAISARASDDLRIENVAVEGECASAGKKALGAIYAAVTHPDGVGEVNVSLPDGCAFRPDAYPNQSPAESQTSHPIGISVTDDHRGELTFRDCHVEGWVNNGGYLAGGTGPCFVEGGLWKGNGNANLRLGDGDEASGVEIEVDETEYTGCGLWLQEGDARVSNAEIRLPDCDNDGLRISSRSARVRDLKIECESSARAIKVNDGDGPVVLENVELVDSGDGAIHGYCVELWRDGTELRDCRFAFRNGTENRHGINVLGEGIVFDGVTATHDADGNATMLVKADDVAFRNSTFRGRVDVDRKNASPPHVEGGDFADCECIGFEV
ncbi:MULTISPECIES: hypothetical protein [unclassified Haladaptatus]|uniref:hypothetical protein n=1 Tax=unclassified Haladaptatus TaxID=2622732 RepID=UPI00209BD347|nr:MULTISPECIES: hypothetical protein [unclassified Haladaptatus]MCO8244125.1 hypothetical protein [Haladaptatus sp. AB643]MCO8255930.1 hypothetical protein [Haladaptatus sp. AB618]